MLNMQRSRSLRPASTHQVAVHGLHAVVASSRAGRRSALSGERPSGRVVMPVLRAVEAEAVLEEIDPITGQVIPKFSASNPVASLKVNVNGVEWAYRQSEPAADKASADKPVVLLVHGLGSSSYAWRNTVGLLGRDGYDAIAFDWPGHGDSDKPANFDYSEQGFVKGLTGFVKAAGLEGRPIALVVQGFVLPQYALLWALENEDKVTRLMILNTPLALNSKLRPELAAYKAPLAFMRPKSFDSMSFAASGNAYVMERRDADAYARPFAEPAASAAVSATMDKLDFGKLLAKVDDGYRTWRKPSVVLFGGADPFLNLANPNAWLETKRTNMKVITPGTKLGHAPQEDFADAVHDSMLPWLSGESDNWNSGAMMKALKMTKRGAVEA